MAWVISRKKKTPSLLESETQDMMKVWQADKAGDEVIFFLGGGGGYTSNVWKYMEKNEKGCVLELFHVSLSVGRDVSLV